MFVPRSDAAQITKLMELQLKYLDLFMIDIRCIIHQMGVLYTN